ncbi:sensor histidine kinase [Pseudonocardia sp. TMWB2A]|uniref:sensor histidine kinase n=1 Tax=Pseudonocardia sp. TMWB2A TaxID=687430 RepID=UPI00307E9D68
MRRRIVRLTLVAVGVTLVLFGVPLAAGLERYTVTQQRESLQRIADFAARSVYDDVVHDRVPARLPDGRDDDTAVALYDEDGDLTTGDGPPEGDEGVDRVLDRGLSSSPPGQLVAVSPVTDGDDVIGVVRAARPTSAVWSSLVPLYLGMVALAGLVLVAVWALAMRLAAHLSAPLESMARDAARLGEGDFGVRPAPTGIGELDRVGSALGHTAGRLDDLLARERAFSAEASHQLRTPLTGLRLRLESALDDPALLRPATVEDGLASVDRLERTIDELLLLARERSRDAVPVDLARLFDEAQAEWGDRLSRAGRSFSVSRDGALPDPPASAAAVRQIVAALLDNAVQHGAGAVTLTARESGPDAVAVDVADEGPGVAEEDLSGSDGRRGLGVALARRLAEAEGGRLTARRSPSVVTLLLPLEPVRKGRSITSS